MAASAFQPAEKFRTITLHRNILIIEDDESTAEMLMMTLGMHGYGVRHVKSRDEAIVALRVNEYQIAIMDLYMPGLGAEEFVMDVRHYSPQTRIILTTAGHTAMEKAKDLGIERWLEKPFTPEDLLRTVKLMG